MSSLTTVGRTVIALSVAVLAALIGWILFVETPNDGAELLGVLLVLTTVFFGLRFGSGIANSSFPSYNVAQVAVDGPITRDSGDGFPPSRPGRPGADELVDLIDSADDDDSADALLLKLNTPGGAVVPSDDIRRAAERFDGPTVAYTTDVCASGGYWIASGCDELWAREGSLVGSIGVRGSRLTGSELLDKVGLEYEQLTAGEYKEAGVPLKDLDTDERAYLQRIIDGYYDQFVETVADGREMDAGEIRETQARIYLGAEAHEIGLVDDIGTREDVETRLEALLDSEVSVTELEPEVGLTQRVRGGAERVAYALGAGVGSHLIDADGEFRFRV